MVREARAISHAALKVHLSYDSETGAFIWLAPMSNRVKAGSAAGSFHSATGYRYLTFDGRTYKAHRLAWFYVFGEWPVGDVDHINGIRTDNRLANLRVVSRSVNLQNQRKARSNNLSSGVLGVCASSHGKKWRASIKIDGKQVHLGRFDDVESASAAYMAAKRKFHEGCAV